MKTNVEEMIDERATGIVATAFERVHAFVEQFPAVAMSDVLFDVAAKLRKPKLYKPPTMALLNIALAQYGEHREDVTRFIMLDSDFTILTLCQRDSQTGRSVPGGVVYKDVVQAFGRQVLATNPLPASEDYGQIIWRGDAVAAGKASFALRKPEPEPKMAVLCTDADLEYEYHNLEDLPEEVYDKVNGLARYCATATRQVLLLASQMYLEELGPTKGAARDYHRFDPGQLKDATVHWALMLAFDSCRERSSEALYSELRDYHDRKRTEAIASWQLTIAPEKPQVERKVVTFTQITDEPELPKADQWYLDDCGDFTQAQHDFTALKYLIFERTESTDYGKLH